MPDASSLLVAHAGHWAVWVLYAAPVIAVLVALLIGSLRERGRREGEGERPLDWSDGGDDSSATG